jgi:hypothetical protein
MVDAHRHSLLVVLVDLALEDVVPRDFAAHGVRGWSVRTAWRDGRCFLDPMVLPAGQVRFEAVVPRRVADRFVRHAATHYLPHHEAVIWAEPITVAHAEIPVPA